MIVMDAATVAAGLTRAGPARELLAAEELHLPHGTELEVVAVLGERVRAGTLDQADAVAGLEVLGRFGITWHPMLGHLDRLWQLAAHLPGAVAAAVALAEALGCGLATADADLPGTPGLGCPVTLVAG